jgi:hypothetical protein
MENDTNEITVRELIGDVLTAVIALAERVTGERLTVCAKTDVADVPLDTRPLTEIFPEGHLLRLSDS